MKNIISQSLALRFGKSKKVRAIESLQQGAQLWEAHRDSLNLGSSESPLVTVIDTETGTTVARISYNARIWTPDGKEILPCES